MYFVRSTDNRDIFSDLSKQNATNSARALPANNAATLPLSEVASVMSSLTNPAEEQKDTEQQSAMAKKQELSAAKVRAGESSKKRTLVVQRHRSILPKSFRPGPYDVICARGKDAANHSGNVYFRKLVARYSMDYGNATSRCDKTMVVSSVVEQIRSKCADYGGGFIKLGKDRRWYEIGENGAREKVGQHLREKLHTRYKSSTKAKRRMKKEMNRKIEGHLKTAVTSNVAISRKIHRLSNTINTQAVQSAGEGKAEEMKQSSDTELEQAMTAANSAILASLKTDESLNRIWREGKRLEEEGEGKGDSNGNGNGEDEFDVFAQA